MASVEINTGESSTASVSPFTQPLVWYVSGALVSPTRRVWLAAAIAAWMFTRDARFTARHRGLQAVGIALLAYVILPLATLAWAFPSLWLAQAMGASTTLQPGMASQLPTLAVTWSVIALIATGVPFALVEYVVVRVARKQAAGATAPGAKK